MNSKKFKELKIAHRFLSECDLSVPQELLVELSGMILEEERVRKARKMDRMSEEELAAWSEKRTGTVEVWTSEGLLIRSKKNCQTLVSVLSYVGLERVWTLGLQVGKHPLVMRDESGKRTRMAQYVLAEPGFFVFRTASSDTIARLLRVVDERLEVGLEIKCK